MNEVISREIRTLAVLLYHPPKKYKKNALWGCVLALRSRSPLSVVAGGGMLMPTALASIYIASV